ncbi:MAG: glycosyltransferase [Leptospiraceae bacterium]|nr:glycosyltransferase [Leptospiraceae bacterium]MCP5510543.1 glycosyltransferase [Leptospiraceae bacterium]
MNKIHSLYSAFDIYPSSKGASTHIYHMFETLVDFSYHSRLLTLGTDKHPEYQEEDQFEIFRIRLKELNFLKRTEEFAKFVHRVISNSSDLDLVHFRDIWGGMPVFSAKRKYKTLFEVNSFPSIELPYRYSALSESTILKIREMEDFCLKSADRILTPSQITSNYIINERKIDRNKIQIISNGALLPEDHPKPTDVDSPYIIYFGALQEWQGIDVLIHAMESLKDLNLKLILCASNTGAPYKYLRRLIEKQGLSEKIIWKFMISKRDLNAYLQHAIASIIPLKENSRNLIQGASPIKIFESMSNHCPIIASDLPIVSEVLQEDVTAGLVRPERPLDLSRMIRFFYENKDFRRELAENAFNLFLKSFTWDQKKKELKDLYHELVFSMRD